MKTLTLLLDNNNLLVQVSNESTLKELKNLTKEKPFTYKEISEFLIDNFNHFESQQEQLLFSVLYTSYDPEFEFKDHVTIIFEVTPFGVHCDWNTTKQPMDIEELRKKYRTFINNRPNLAAYHRNKAKKSLAVSE